MTRRGLLGLLAVPFSRFKNEKKNSALKVGDVITIPVTYMTKPYSICTVPLRYTPIDIGETSSYEFTYTDDDPCLKLDYPLTL